MATLNQSPEEFSAVGGLLPNPMNFNISSSENFETISLRNSAGSVIATLRKRVLSGVVVFDVSKYLEGELGNQEISTQANTFADANAIFEYYITGSSIDTSGFRRYAVPAKLDGENSSMLEYVTGSVVKKFLTFFQEPEIIIGHNNFLSILCNSNANIYLNLTNKDMNQNIISTSRTLLGNTFENTLIRVLIPFLLSACTSDVVLLEGAGTTELFSNTDMSAGSDGLQSWEFTDTENNSAVDWRLNSSPNDAKIIMPGATVTDARSNIIYQTVNLQAGNDYEIELNFTMSSTDVAPFAIVEIMKDGVRLIQNTYTPSTQVFTHTFTADSSGSSEIGIQVTLQNSHAPPFEDGEDVTFVIDSLSLEEISFNEICETKTVRYVNPINCKGHALTWVNTLGGWDSYLFQGKSTEYKSIKEVGRVSQEDGRNERTLGKKVRSKMKLSAPNLSRQEAKNLEDIHKSRAVYLINKDSSLTKVIIKAQNIPEKSSENDYFDVVLEIELPYENA